jgi:hypothetical protein
VRARFALELDSTHAHSTSFVTLGRRFFCKALIIHEGVTAQMSPLLNRLYHAIDASGDADAALHTTCVILASVALVARVTLATFGIFELQIVRCADDTEPEGWIHTRAGGCDEAMVVYV